MLHLTKIMFTLFVYQKEGIRNQFSFLLFQQLMFCKIVHSHKQRFKTSQP